VGKSLSGEVTTAAEGKPGKPGGGKSPSASPSKSATAAEQAEANGLCA